MSEPEIPVLAEADHPKDECGVFGVFAPGEDVARLTYFGLFALQLLLDHSHCFRSDPRTVTPLALGPNYGKYD